MADMILCEVSEGVATVTINRPELRNPISEPEFVDTFIAEIERLDADIAVRVIILTGAGTAFSSGGNLKTMHKGAGLIDELPVNTRRNYLTGIQRIPMAFEKLEVPTIAAVNGAAIGAGCDLACMCDMRIAGESAFFAESFVKLGIVAGDGGCWLLPRIVGYSKACELALTGDRISSSEALAIGLVSKVVADAELMSAARQLARRIASNPVHAVRMTKRLLREAAHVRMDTLLQMSAAMQALAHETADHVEAVSAMLEKRLPRFTGK